MTTSAAKEKLRQELRVILKKNREAFKGRYGDQITELLSLSKDDIDAITPDTTDLATYDLLIEVVKDASRKNLSQAQLRARIKELGQVGVAIAKRAIGLKGLFV